MMRLETERTMQEGGEKRTERRAAAIAHVRAHDQSTQLLKTHLEGVAALAQKSARKISQDLSGELISHSRPGQV